MPDLHADSILYVTPFRRRARAVERELQAALDEDLSGEGVSLYNFKLMERHEVPEWARGVKVQRAGLFQWAVVATERRGH